MSELNTIRFGILSTAKIARTHAIAAIQQAPGCSLVAISSRSLQRAEDVANEYGIPKAYGSDEELLNDPEVDAVYIPTPNDLHVQQAVLAASKGKHVICEKPIAMSADEAMQLVRARDQYGVQITEAFMVRYHPRWLLVRDLVRSGRIGQPQLIHASYTVLNENADDIRFDPAKGGGALMDVGVYPITAARFIFEDEPQYVFAQTTLCPRTQVDETVVGVLSFTEGRRLMFSGSLKMAWDHWIRIVGTEGSIEVPIAVWADVSKETEIRIRDVDDINDERLEVIKIPAQNQYQNQFASFAQMLLGGSKPLWTIENAVAGMSIIDALVKSAKSGRTEPVHTR